MKWPIVQGDSVEKLVDVATDLDSLLKHQLKEDHLKHRAKEEKKTSNHLENIRCSRCERDFMFEKEAIFYRCTECEYEACRFCHQPKQDRLNDRHDGCRVLHLAGSKCFTDPKIFPDNWHSLFSAQIFIVGWQSFGWQCHVELNSLEGQAIVNMFCNTFSRPSISQWRQMWESPYSRFSYHYTGGCKCMIIARVLCGNSTEGSRALTRPPKDSSGRFYDTTVNSLNMPLKFCVFDNSQCYPAYIIDYSMK